MQKTIEKTIEVSAIETRSICKTYTITRTVDIDEEVLEEDYDGDEDSYLEDQYEEMEAEAEDKLREEWESEIVLSSDGSAELEDVEGEMLD